MEAVTSGLSEFVYIVLIFDGKTFNKKKRNHKLLQL